MERSTILLLIGSVLSLLGTVLIDFAVPLLVYQTTESISESGTLVALVWSARVLGYYLAGPWSTRRGELALIKRSELLRAFLLVAGVFSYFAVPSVFRLPLLITIASVDALLSGLYITAFECAIPLLSSGAKVYQAQAVFETSSLIAKIGGPFLGAAVVTLFPLSTLFYVAINCFLINTALLFWYSPKRKYLRSGVQRYSLRKVLAFVRHQPILLRMTLWAMTDCALIGMLYALMVPIVVGEFKLPEKSWGMLSGGAGVAGILCAAGVSLSLTKIRPTLLGLSSFFLQYVGLLMIALASNVVWIAAGFGLVEASLSVGIIYLSNERVRLIPKGIFSQVTPLLFVLHELPVPLAGVIVSLFGEGMGSQKLLGVSSLIGGIFTGILLLRIVRDRWNVHPEEVPETHPQNRDEGLSVVMRNELG